MITLTLLHQTLTSLKLFQLHVNFRRLPFFTNVRNDFKWQFIEIHWHKVPWLCTYWCVSWTTFRTIFTFVTLCIYLLVSSWRQNWMYLSFKKLWLNLKEKWSEWKIRCISWDTTNINNKNHQIRRNIVNVLINVIELPA